MDHLKILSIDIGGTTIKSDLYNESGVSLNVFQETPTQINHNQKTNNIINQVLEIISNYINQKNIDGITISSAGVINAKSGEVAYSGYTIPGYTNTKFKEKIEKEFTIPCYVENDVNCMALGEYWLGAAENSKSVLCLTIGTGIGGSIILDGEILNGHSFSAGEVGYIPVKDNNWQDIASTSSMVRHYEKITNETNVDGRKIFEAYDSGNVNAIKVINRFVNNFSDGLLSGIYLINPERIVIGGGIMDRDDILLPKIIEKLTKKIENDYFLPKEIYSAQLGNEAGRIGAIYNFLKNRGENI